MSRFTVYDKDYNVVGTGETPSEAYLASLAFPVGEHPEVGPRPRPTIVSVARDLTTRCAELEADNDHLCALLREVRDKNAALTQELERIRGERDVAAAQAAWGRGCP